MSPVAHPGLKRLHVVRRFAGMRPAPYRMTRCERQLHGKAPIASVATRVMRRLCAGMGVIAMAGVPSGCTVSEGAETDRTEALVVAGLGADEAKVRMAACHLIGCTGDVRHVQKLGKLVRDGDVQVRYRALMGVVNIMTRRREAVEVGMVYVIACLRDEDERVRQFAVMALSRFEAGPSVWSEVTACLRDPAAKVRIAAGATLLHQGVALSESDVEKLCGLATDSEYERQVSHLTDLLTLSTQRALLPRLLQSKDVGVQRRAELAARRLEGGAEAEDRWRNQQMARRVHAAENRTALEQLGGSAWEEVERGELLDKIASARLVVFADASFASKELRSSQLEALRAWIDTDGSGKVLAMQPGMERRLRDMAALAEGAAVQILNLGAVANGALDDDDLCAQDAVAVTAINDVLGEEGKRVFVVYPSTRAIPGGYLVRRLADDPVVVVLGDEVPVPLSVIGELRWSGRTWRLGAGGRVYVLGCRSPLDDIPGADGALRKWMLR